MAFSRTRILSALSLILIFVSYAWAAGPNISLAVDATETPRKILHARLRIPAAPGSLILYYPKWLPGEHAPTGPVIDLAGLRFFAGGKPLRWRRDLLDGWTINVEAPPGKNEVEAALDSLDPATLEEGFSS